MKTPLLFLNRREFLGHVLAGSALLCAPTISLSQPTSRHRIVVFSKIYQSLKLTYEESAELTAEAGLDGVDCALRPGGEVEPARVDQDLPRYLAALQKHKLIMPMIASGITGLDSPHAEPVLRALSKAGIKHYRLAPIRPDKDPAKRAQQVAGLREKLIPLAALNKELGITAVIQNHSPGHGYLAGDVGELAQLLEGFEPEQVGAAFDLGHAIVVHGNRWPEYFDKIKSHQQVAYVKDVTTGGKWVPFGEGEFSNTDYFARMKRIRYAAPYSIHIEYDWEKDGATRSNLLKALKHSREKLVEWLQRA